MKLDDRKQVYDPEKTGTERTDLSDDSPDTEPEQPVQPVTKKN